MNNYILNLLNIEDRNIFILPNIEERIIKNKKYKIIEGILTYIPDFCPCCGCVNESHNAIIKWGYRKNCKVKIPKISNCFSLLILHKQRFFCRNYNKTFIAKTSLIDKNNNLDGLIFHSDQGWQYQHQSYQQSLKNNGIKQSMSRKRK